MKVVDGCVERTLKIPADAYHYIRILAAKEDTTITAQLGKAMRWYVAYSQQQEKDKEG
jgi:hypothetical protein